MGHTNIIRIYVRIYTLPDRINSHGKSFKSTEITIIAEQQQYEHKQWQQSTFNRKLKMERKRHGDVYKIGIMFFFVRFIVYTYSSPLLVHCVFWMALHIHPPFSQARATHHHLSIHPHVYVLDWVSSAECQAQCTDFPFLLCVYKYMYLHTYHTPHTMDTYINVCVCVVYFVYMYVVQPDCGNCFNTNMCVEVLHYIHLCASFHFDFGTSFKSTSLSALLPHKRTKTIQQQQHQKIK